jgi:predicted transglutaminase-like cysteine proteinase
MQGRSIMSVFGKIGRIIFLGAVCCNVAFADTHPRRFSSIADRRGGRAPDIQLVPENKSANLTLPQLASLTSHLTHPGETASLSSEPLGGKTPGIQLVPENKSTNLASPQLASLVPNPTDQSEIALPSTEPFDLPAMTARPGEMPAKWADLQSRILTDERTLAACSSGTSPCPHAARRFLSIVEIGRKRQGRARLGWINRAVNLSIRPMSDWAQYGYADFWASPLQTLNSLAGDCEDYAIVKYMALRELGIAPGDLRFVIVQDIMRQSEHAILAVRYEQKWLILDNLMMAMRDSDHTREYYPMFVMDSRGVRTFSTASARR